MGCSEADWLDNSRTSIEGLKTIFYHIFPHDKDKDLKLEFSKIYEIFAEEHARRSSPISTALECTTRTAAPSGSPPKP